MNTTPVSLLEKLRSPEANDAWPEFVALYTPLLYHWAGRLGLEGQDAADFLQDVFVLLLQKLPEFRYDPNRRFRGWLRIVFLNLWRERKRRSASSLPLAGDDRLKNLEIEDPALDEAEYRQYLVARALDLMRSQFHPTTWKACWDLVVNGRPAAEVASSLGLTVNAVYLAKSRVLAHLRKRLEGLVD